MGIGKYATIIRKASEHIIERKNKPFLHIILLFGCFFLISSVRQAPSIHFIYPSLIDRYGENWLATIPAEREGMDERAKELLPEEAKQVTDIFIIGNNFFPRLPIKGEDFPNVTSISLLYMSEELLTLTGINEFSNIKTLAIDESNIGIKPLNITVAHQIAQITTLEELHIEESSFLILDTSFLKLKKLRVLSVDFFTSLPIHILSKMRSLEKIQDPYDIAAPYGHYNLSKCLDLYMLSKMNTKLNEQFKASYAMLTAEKVIGADNFNYKNKKYSGSYTLLYKNGKSAVTGMFKNGWMAGTWEYFNITGEK